MALRSRLRQSAIRVQVQLRLNQTQGRLGYVRDGCQGSIHWRKYINVSLSFHLRPSLPFIPIHHASMADARRSTDGPSPFSPEAFDPALLPDFDREFLSEEDVAEFARALAAPENAGDDLEPAKRFTFITALNDWRPVHQRVRARDGSSTTRRKRRPGRGRDETREGFVYALLKWPLLMVVFTWIIVLSLCYLLTRLYVWLYEQYVTWRGTRQRLRRKLQSANCYAEWVDAAKELDRYLGNEEWRQADEYAYYDSGMVRRVKEQIRRARLQAEADEEGEQNGVAGEKAIDELKSLLEACVKANFAGTENPRLYGQTYYGTKENIQQFVDEVEASLSFALRTRQLSAQDKRALFKQIHTNFGRSALCLSGGATFAYYHFGVVKAILDANLLPQVITGTSGGALVAALVATRTDDELKRLLVPALAARITACHDNLYTWIRRLYRTGARFDSIEWARKCSWFSRGSLTFQEAYERTGRILNVTCVPSDPHSPTILANYLTSPDCVIWSAVLASAAVPGILSPVVLMMKKRDGSLAPYSFGNKWKDGSLRTDIPLSALRLQFNVHFSIASQTNPHVNLFFFSPYGSVGRPVTHRRGRGWRGGFLGSAMEQYIKLDLNKWLKVLRHLELLPRPLGQDWSQIWLQRFSGTVTIWPKSVLSDFYYILSDPTPVRLARMLQVGQRSAFPKLKFISNRLKVERVVEEGRRASSDGADDLRIEANGLIQPAASLVDGAPPPSEPSLRHHQAESPSTEPHTVKRPPSSRAKSSSPTLTHRLSRWWSEKDEDDNTDARHETQSDRHGEGSQESHILRHPHRRQRSDSVFSEIGRQSLVFFDDDDLDDDDDDDDGQTDESSRSSGHGDPGYTEEKT